MNYPSILKMELYALTSIDGVLRVLAKDLLPKAFDKLFFDHKLLSAANRGPVGTYVRKLSL